MWNSFNKHFDFYLHQSSWQRIVSSRMKKDGKKNSVSPDIFMLSGEIMRLTAKIRE